MVQLPFLLGDFLFCLESHEMEKSLISFKTENSNIPAKLIECFQLSAGQPTSDEPKTEQNK